MWNHYPIFTFLTILNEPLVVKKKLLIVNSINFDADGNFPFQIVIKNYCGSKEIDCETVGITVSACLPKNLQKYFGFRRIFFFFLVAWDADVTYRPHGIFEQKSIMESHFVGAYLCQNSQ